MLERASGQFEIDGQVEDILGGISGAARIARISQSCRFSGQLEGESMAEFTAVLPRESDGSFHGFQRITGTLGEREGSFVLNVSGEYHRGQPRGSWTIVPKSGSGDFVHIRGSGTFSLPDGKPGKYSLEFDLRKPRAMKSAVQPETPDELAMAQDIADDPIEETPAIIEELALAAPKPMRKPRKKSVEIPAEPVDEIAPKGKRPRKRAPEAVTPVVIAEAPSKRARTRKAFEDVAPAAAVVDSAPTTKRSRKTVPAVTEPDSLPAPENVDATPKRLRRAATTSPVIEPTEALAEPELSPAKPARRKKAIPIEPMALPVAEPAPARRRRAKAA